MYGLKFILYVALALVLIMAYLAVIPDFAVQLANYGNLSKDSEPSAWYIFIVHACAIFSLVAFFVGYVVAIIFKKAHKQVIKASEKLGFGKKKTSKK